MTFASEKPLASLTGKFLFLPFMALRMVAKEDQNKVRQVLSFFFFFWLLSLAFAVLPVIPKNLWA